MSVAALEARVVELERLVAKLSPAGPDQPLSLAEVAVRVGRTRGTLKTWLRSPELRERHRLDLLLVRVAGRWSSSPRRIETWRRAIAQNVEMPTLEIPLVSKMRRPKSRAGRLLAALGRGGR